MEGLIAAQIRLEVKIRMDKLEERWRNERTYPKLYHGISTYLQPSQSAPRVRIAQNALKKWEGASSTDLAARVTEAAETAILEEFHKGIDKELRGYMN